MAFTPLEVEVTGLKSAIAASDDPLDHSFSPIAGQDPNSLVRFPDAWHRGYSTFSSSGTPERASHDLVGQKGPSVDAIGRIAGAPRKHQSKPRRI